MDTIANAVEIKEDVAPPLIEITEGDVLNLYHSLFFLLEQSSSNPPPPPCSTDDSVVTPRIPSSVCGKRKEREESEHAAVDAQPPATKKGRTEVTLPALVGLFLLVLCAFGRQIFVLLERQGPKDALRVFIACTDAEFIAQHFASEPAQEYNRKNATTIFRKMGPAALPFGGRSVALLRQRAGTNATSQSLLFTTGAAFLARLAVIEEQEKAKGHAPLTLTRAMLDASRYGAESCRLSRYTSPDGSTSLTRAATLTAPQLTEAKEAFCRAIGI